MTYFYNYIYILIFFLLYNITISIKLCVRKNQSISREVFFQRVETETVDKCLERCLDNVDICRSLVFIKNIQSKNDWGMCQLYTINSESNPINFENENPLESSSIIYEIAEHCGKDSYEMNNKVLTKFISNQEFIAQESPEKDATYAQVPVFKISNKKISLTTTSPIQQQSMIKPIVPVHVSHAQTGLFGLPPLPCTGILCTTPGTHTKKTPSPIEAILSALNLTTTTQKVIIKESKQEETKIYSKSETGREEGENVINVDVKKPCQAISEGDPCIARKKEYVIITKVEEKEERKFGIWSEWEQSSPCSVSVGTGIIQYRRTCITKEKCIGESRKEEICKIKSYWSNWSPWTTCSASCEGGVKSRKRECLGGSDCKGHVDEVLMCNIHKCPFFEEWNAWSDCSITCGGNGVRIRNRNCRYLGVLSSNCKGPAQDQILCSTDPCPRYLEWQEWQDCSVSCGQGIQKRIRTCYPKGIGCKGGDQEVKFCQKSVCPYLSEWSEFGGCSVTCGIGYCERKRECIFDETSESHKKISERSSNSDYDGNFDSVDLRRQVLEVNQSDIRRAPIRIKNDTSVFSGCIGSLVERKLCDAGPCCYLTNWTEWSSCHFKNKKCLKNRNRSCMPDANYQSSRNSTSDIIKSNEANIKSQSLNILSPIKPINDRRRDHRQVIDWENYHCDCREELKEEEECNENECKTTDGSFSPHIFIEKLSKQSTSTQPQTYEIPLSSDCTWSSWSDFSTCTTTGSCNKGAQARTRTCQPVKMIVLSNVCNCPGSNVDARSCIPYGCMTNDDHGVMLKVASDRGHLDTAILDYEQEINSNTKTAIKINSKSVEDSDNNKITTLSFDCNWSTWESWNVCINPGIQTRSRKCPKNCKCQGIEKEDQKCNINENQTYEALKSPRSVSEVPPSKYTSASGSAESNSGYDNYNDNVDLIVYARDQKINKKCEFFPWSEWSDCSNNQSKGEKVRIRLCGCKDCGDGKSVETQICDGSLDIIN